MDLVSRNATDTWLMEQLKDKMPAGGTPPQIISDVSRRLARYTGRADWGASASRTEYKDGGTKMLLMDYWPITAITSIHDDIDHDYEANTLIDSNEYFISLNYKGANNDGIIYMESWRLDNGDQNVKVIYTGGYTAPGASDVPDDLKLAAYMQILYEVTRQVPGAFVSVPGNFESPNFEEVGGTGLLGEVRDLLNPYTRRKPFA